MTLPRQPGIDDTRAFFREGYEYVGNRCRSLGSDAFRTRIMLHDVVCMMGEDAARQFYDGVHLTRQGAMPSVTLRLLQDKGSVQSLNGEAHRVRKALFLDLLGDDAVQEIGDMFANRWRIALPRWQEQGRIVLHDATARLLCETICAWAGVPVADHALTRRTREMAAMIDGAGTVGLRAWRALLLRRRAERWACDALATARAQPAKGSPVSRLAHFHGSDGRLLDLDVAAVELLNLIRPTVAVARFITFAALALHEHPEAAVWLDEDQIARRAAFVDEVRRYYPFFPVIGGRVRSPFRWREHDFEYGDWVLLGLHATNYDARIWHDPERFRPERFINRASSGFDLIPQGAGEHARDHRCPGEWFTIELIGRALMALRGTNYRVPEQQLQVPTNRFPTLPCSGMIFDLS